MRTPDQLLIAPFKLRCTTAISRPGTSKYHRLAHGQCSIGNAGIRRECRHGTGFTTRFKQIFWCGSSGLRTWSDGLTNFYHPLLFVLTLKRLESSASKDFYCAPTC